MGINKKGTDARRRILNPGAGFDSEISDLRRSVPPSSFYRAVVVEVLNDLSTIPERLEELKSSVVNPEFLTNVPRNSTIVRVISNARDRKNSSPIVCYPFLPPYLSLPVKAGEQVWVMFENERVSTRLGYWLWRAPEPDHVDDLNYTHGDRRFDKTGTQRTSEKVNGSDKMPGFPNGGGTSASRSLYGESDYEDIVEGSISYSSFTPEAIPRFTKRPGDSVLQGSNNTLISLGEDRVGPSTDQVEGGGSGTIDIVAGRGRFEDSEGSPPVVTNDRGNEETNKNPSAFGGQANEKEGDPDLKNDASRIIVSQKTNADDNFGVVYPSPFKTEAGAVTESPFVVIKSDEVRILGRKDDSNGINGSVRIVKEGEQGKDLAAILLLPDGTVQVDGSVIYLGRTGGKGPGDGGSEPYIKFSEYKSQMEELIGIVNDLMKVFTATFTIPDPPMSGGPSPSLSAALSNDGGVASAIVNLATLKSKLDNAKSSRIFGE